MCLSRLAEDLLLLDRADDGRVPLKTEEADVADLVEQVARRFDARVDAEPLVATMDSLRVEQALTNLVDNAVRHGGGDVAVTAVRRNGSFELHVLDEGAGFPAAFVAHPFERFSRADPALPDGSGLGLAIVETIARAHGGEAHAANRSSGGADVWLALPLRPVR